MEARKPRHRSARHGQSRRAVASLVLVGAVAGAGILYWHTHPGNETVETWLSDWMEHGNVIKVSDVSCTNTGQTVTDGGEVFDCVMSVVQRSRNRKIDYTYRMSVTAFTVEDMTGNRGSLTRID